MTKRRTTSAPKINTKELTSLTPELAEQLIRQTKILIELPRLTHLDLASAEKLASWTDGGGLFLNGLTSLDAATAEKLALWQRSE